MSQDAARLDVRGFVVPRADGQWYAHCIDLAVDALAPTRQGALEKLNQAAIAYLEWASERNLPLLRRSPLRFRLRYYAYVIQDKVRPVLRGSLRRPGSPRTFHHSPMAA